MYRFSRAIYRELAPRVVEDQWSDHPGRRHLLEASEATMKRLATDRRHFAKPARKLFSEVREHFAIGDQLHVFRVIDRNVGLALEMIAKLPPGVSLDGTPRSCHATTRKGQNCQREPLPARDYCPSHKHLEEPYEEIHHLAA